MWVAHGLDAPEPVRQYVGRVLGTTVAWAVQPPAGGTPQLSGIAQILELEARAAVDGGEQLDRDVGLHSLGLLGELVEVLLDAPVDVIKGAVDTVVEVFVQGAAVVGDGALPAPGAGDEIVIEGLARDGSGTAAGALGEGNLAKGYAVEGFLGAAASMVGCDRALVPDHSRRLGAVRPRSSTR
ncbi:MAG: hypothetical protein OXF79_00700 [Chloroflexi bacterium]|nr:hypothetical protein [Chloroflexota bacterium]